MNIFYKILFLFFFPLFLFSSENIDDLLDNYKKESALDRKTKKDTSGHNIVFTRDDLDQMQANTLKDVLKSLRNLTMMENDLGAVELQRAGGFCTNSACVRLYINDQELTSAAFGGALMIFGEYDLGHIDHIQIYLGGNGIEFGNEYGFVSIKMYTKDANREKGSSLSLSYGTNNSHIANALTTGTLDNDINYLLYASKLENNKNSLENKGYSIPRYAHTYNLFATFKRENDFILEFSNYHTEHDALGGFGDLKTPSIATRDSGYQYISLTKFIDTIKFQVSYAQEHVSMENNDDNGITLHNNSVVSEISNALDNDIFRIHVQDSQTLDNHQFTYGVEYQHKKMKGNFIVDGQDLSNEFQGPDSLAIYILFLEYQYKITRDTLFLATGKLERYEQNYANRSDDLAQGRMGIVSRINDKLELKGFVSQNYIYPALVQLATVPRPVKGNPNLTPINIDTISAELTYKDENYQLGLGYMRMYTTDPIAVSADKIYINRDVEAIFDDYFINYTYVFNKKNKILLEYFLTNHNRPFDQSPSAGGHVKLFNSYKAFDFYTEFIYRRGYFHREFSMLVDDGYDLTTAITYKVSKKTSISLKGENLLDKAILAPIRNLYPVGTLDRRVLVNVEWFF